MNRAAASARVSPFDQGDLLPRHGPRHGPLDLLDQFPSPVGLADIFRIEIEDPTEHPAGLLQIQRRQIALAHEIIGGGGLGIDQNRLIEGILRAFKPGIIGSAFGSDPETRRMAQRTYTNSSHQGKDFLFIASGVIFRLPDCLESTRESPGRP